MFKLTKILENKKILQLYVCQQPNMYFGVQ